MAWTSRNTQFSLVVILSIALAIIAIVAATKVHYLSLPVSPARSVITVLLPLLSGSNSQLSNFIHTRVLRSKPPYISTQSVLSLFLLLTATVLSTLNLSSLIPSEAQHCTLSSAWQSLFSQHAAPSIRRIQDAHDCCGFNSPAHESWPFNGVAGRCAEMFGRTRSCAASWRADLITWNGVMLVVNLGVAVEAIFWLWIVWTRTVQGPGVRAGQSAERRTAPAITEYSDEEQQEESTPRDEEEGEATRLLTGGLRI
ncbi:MAG: hypothetical protein M1814_002727 [Vezdaea aestivalis]|nr:MAG: hypothetical protein M1814_002727 [Vezdaea aestivalis]